MYYAYVNQNNCIEQIHDVVAEPQMYQEVSNCPSDLIAAPFVYRYKLADGQAVARTQAEIDTDIAALPAPTPTTQEQFDAQAAAIEELAELLAGVME